MAKEVKVKNEEPVIVSVCEDGSFEGSGWGEKLYAEKQRQKKRKQVIYWTAVAIIIGAFLGAGTFFRLILGSGHRLTRSVSRHTLDLWNVVDTFSSSIDPLVRTVSAVFISFLILKAIWLFTKFMGRRGSNRRKTVLALAYSFAKYIVIVITFFALLGIWVDMNASTILASAGVIGVMIAFGAQNILSDILAGLFIVFEDSFEVGDIIVAAPGGAAIRGEVIHIGIRTTMIKGVDGNVTVINNSDLRMVINQTQDQSVAVVNAVVSYNEDLEHVEKVIMDAVPALSKKLTTIIEMKYLGATEFMERGVEVRIIAKCEEVDRLPLTRDLHREIKSLFDKNGISFAPPRMIVSQAEVKAPTTRAKK